MPIQQYYNTNDDTASQIVEKWGYWSGQTFTPSTTHTITSVKGKFYRDGTPGTVTVGIRATSGGEPTGADLCSGTTDGDAITDSSPGEWVEITMDAGGTELTADTMYAIVIRQSDAGGDSLYWRCDNTSPSYAGGTQVYSFDSGATWATGSGTDFMFEEWSSAAAGTNITIGVDDTYKDVDTAYVNVDDAWKEVASAVVNKDDTWKTIF